MSLDKSTLIMIATAADKVVDDSLKKNAENASGAGLEVRVSRMYDGVGLSGGRDCEWCKDRECNDVTIQEAYRIGAFQRHDGCGCIIEYMSMRGEKTYQTGKSGRDDWLSEEEFNRRVNHGLNGRAVTPQERNINAAIEMQVRDKYSSTLVNAVIENHEALKYYTPEGMKRRLERAGYVVAPLSDGSWKGIPFEDGGGYKINFGGDGIFQYHPSKASHHEGEYWKTQMQGIGEWYDMQGKIINRKINGKTIEIN